MTTIFRPGRICLSFRTKFCCIGRQVLSTSDEGKPGVRMTNVFSLLIQRDDFIALGQAFLIVRDHDDSFALRGNVLEMAYKCRCRFVVQFIKRFIEQDKISILVNSPGKGYSLLLASADVFSILRNDLIKSFRKFRNE